MERVQCDVVPGPMLVDNDPPPPPPKPDRTLPSSVKKPTDRKS
jgi:hypothetical protein